MVTQYKQEFIEFMVRSGVLTFGDFTTKSGRKTPYFINTGNYNTGEQAAKLGYFYAKCIEEQLTNGRISNDCTTLFGPAYKGIPLAVAASMSLATEFGRNFNYCFNRKEAKDHGEGGSLVGYKLKDNDKVIIIEDVITAGTAIRETLPQLLGAAHNISPEALIISVDRMERGQGELSAVQEVEKEYGIKTFPIVTVREIMNALHNTEIDGKIIITDEIFDKMNGYLSIYGI